MIPFKVHGTEFYNNKKNVEMYGTKAFIEFHTTKVNPGWTYRNYHSAIYKLLCIVPATNKYTPIFEKAFEPGDIEYSVGMIARTKLFI